jgi:ankyrin repeat protein
MAATMGHLDRVRELLDHDPSLVNRIDPYVTYYPGSGAPLKNAAGGGHLAIVELLLQRGADPNLAEDGIAPLGGALYGAVSGGHFAIAELLLEHGANPNGTVESSADCLTIALLRGDGRMAELLASHGAARRLELLAYYGDVQTGAAVLAARPDLADDPEVLSIAAEEGQESFVRLMLRLRPDLARRLVCPGARTRALDVLLFRHGADPGRADWLGITPLHRFAAGGEIEKATLFLDHGAPLEARDDELQSTPLGVAARCGQTAMVELLLARGARPNPPDDPPWATPLAWASRREHHEIVGLLEQRGAR